MSAPPVRRAAAASVCAAPGCTALIHPGAPIVRGPGGGWKHEDCARPGRQRRDDRRAERAAAHARTARR